jgi:putative MATE family efflux protein
MAGHDLTQGPVPRWLGVLALPLFLSFILQSAYALADLYFVGFLGGAALAAVGITFNTFLLVLAMAQAVGTGALALISQAFGRRDEAAVVNAFQQAFWLILALGAVLWALGWSFSGPYFDLFTNDPEVRAEGIAYLSVYSATFMLQSFLIAMGACWRAIGSFVWPTVLFSINVLLNTALDPLLIFGWGPVPAFGVAGAAWATVIAQSLAVLAFLWMILVSPRNTLLRVRRPLRLDGALQWGILRIGIPSGLNFLLGSIALGFTYYALRPFGAPVAAALGVGFRILQAIVYPAISVAAATASVTGQNTGARRATRVRQTLAWGVGMAVAITAAQYAVLLVAPHFWVSVFADDPAIVDAGVSYIVINGVAMILIACTVTVTFASQAMGRAMWPMMALVMRVGAYAVLLLALQHLGLISPETVFWAYVGAVGAETLVIACIAAGLLRVTRGWEREPAEGTAPTPHPAAETG